MKNKSIGTIQRVYFNKIVIEVHSPTEIQHNFKGDVYICNGLNDYITIYKDINQKYIYQVTALYEQEKAFNEQEDSKFYQKALFEAIPIGEIEKGNFEYGLSMFPMIGEKVYLATTRDIESIIDPRGKSLSISLGNLTTHQYMPKFNIDTLFSNHMCVLGNTGSGKSTTVRKMLNDLISLKSKGLEPNELNFIIFDVHNEYKSLGNQACYIDVEKISIPLYTLTEDDWINLIQPAAAVQLPVLLNGLKIANFLKQSDRHLNWIRAYCALQLYFNQQTDAVAKRTKIVGLLADLESSSISEVLKEYDSKFGNLDKKGEENFIGAINKYIKEQTDGITFDRCESYLKKSLEQVNPLIETLEELKVGVNLTLVIEESKGNSQVRSHCQTLMTRIDNLILTHSKTLFDDCSKKIKAFNSARIFEKGLTIFDCSSFTDNDLLFFTSYLIRETFEDQQQARKSEGEIKKVYNFFLDEAHRCLADSRNEIRLSTSKIFEKVAKEGRKFGVFLIIASQRPSELSQTVVSQCNNFLIHRIRNNADLEHVRKSIPYINDSQIFRLSYLKTGVCLAVGESFVVPMEIEVDGKKFGQDSKTVKPSDLWVNKEFL